MKSNQQSHIKLQLKQYCPQILMQHLWVMSGMLDVAYVDTEGASGLGLNLFFYKWSWKESDHPHPDTHV